MASDYSDLPEFLATREGESFQSNFSVSDYGAVGDQRPYQVVLPSYPAPIWLSRFSELGQGLRNCSTLCQLKGQPFRLVKWGARLPCYPCRKPKNVNKLPSLRITSPGALNGYPSAQPIAEFRPNGGTIVYGPDGQPNLVGAPNYIVTRTPAPPEDFINFDTPIPVRYDEAVHTAQWLTKNTGQNAYICSSLGGDCRRPKNKAGMQWVPIVYVQPGGVVKRYPVDLHLAQSKSVGGSTTAVTPVTADEFRELIRESAGASRLSKGH